MSSILDGFRRMFSLEYEEFKRSSGAKALPPQQAQPQPEEKEPVRYAPLHKEIEVEVKKFTGTFKDSLGRRVCMQDGQRVPCGHGKESVEEANQPEDPSHPRKPGQPDPVNLGGDSGPMAEAPRRLTTDNWGAQDLDVTVVIWTDAGGYAEVSGMDAWGKFARWASGFRGAPAIVEFVTDGWTDTPGQVLSEFTKLNVRTDDPEIDEVTHNVLKSFQQQPDAHLAVVTVSSEIEDEQGQAPEAPPDVGPAQIRQSPFRGRAKGFFHWAGKAAPREPDKAPEPPPPPKAPPAPTNPRQTAPEPRQPTAHPEAPKAATPERKTAPPRPVSVRRSPFRPGSDSELTFASPSRPESESDDELRLVSPPGNERAARHAEKLQEAYENEDYDAVIWAVQAAYRELGTAGIADLARRFAFSGEPGAGPGGLIQQIHRNIDAAKERGDRERAMGYAARNPPPTRELTFPGGEDAYKFDEAGWNHLLARKQLSQANVERSERLGDRTTNANATYILHLSDGGRAIFKPQDGEDNFSDWGLPRGTLYRREIAASAVAAILGFGDLVPPTVGRDHGGSLGSAQEFVPDAVTGFAFGHANGAPFGNKEDLIRAALFDYIIGNIDRHPGNWLVKKDGRLALIDNGCSFPAAIDNVNHTDLLFEMREGPIPKVPYLRERWPLVEKALTDAGLYPEEIASTKERIDNLLSGEFLTFGDLPDYLSRQA